MKSTLSLTLSFLFVFYTMFLPLAFSRVHEEVLDSNGVPISPCVEYYISMLNHHGPTGCGVELDTDGNSTCQVAVLQNYHENFPSKALKFSTEGTSSGGIFTNTEITFDYHPYCASSSKWVVVAGGDDSFPARWVGIGDAADHPGKKILSGSFMIQKYGEGYKFAFCATIIDNTCFSIGRIDDQ
ncbi:hypothetical protein LR48_Vigan10g056300 [Vigna angularis]|uniref:Uncharacterized protein n=2 Tax=Phaseolus angularis TaxID=3914 RepID=A0A0L9VHY5_PHAAN|nr:hypothetical protein LR48_Vigan10g056300 [Vigna angularis]